MPIYKTGLPDGTEDFVGKDAIIIENLREKLLNRFHKKGFGLVIPSLIEFSEKLGGGSNQELKEAAFSFSDNITGKDISVRPDISQQIARIDIAQGAKGEKRYCYFGETLRKAGDSLTKSKVNFKSGVEFFGKINSAAEKEILSLMIESLKLTGLKKITISLGRTEPMNDLIDKMSLETTQESTLKKIMSTKSETDLIEFCKKLSVKKNNLNDLLLLVSASGSQEILKKLKSHKNSIFQSSSKKIENLIKVLPKGVNYHVDFSDFPGYDYHEGLVFSGHVENYGSAISNGGSYKTVYGKGSSREAIGFDLSVSAVLKALEKES